MPVYIPLITEPAFRCSLSDMTELRWTKKRLDHPSSFGNITADFVIPDNEREMFRVEFDQVEIVRILDEMPLSTEDDSTPAIGRIAEHFAYRVDGGSFWLSQSPAFKAAHKSLQHYQFITGWACLDVIAHDEPRFSTVRV